MHLVPDISADNRIRDYFFELQFDIRETLEEWFSAQTFIEIQQLEFDTDKETQAWRGIPVALIGQLRNLASLISLKHEPLPLPWVQLRKEIAVALDDYTKRANDWHIEVEQR